MGIRKSLIGLLGAAVIGASAFFGAPQKAEADDAFNFTLNVQPDINLYMTPTFDIQSMPEYVRDVPAHPDDGLYNSVAPIKDSGKASFTDFTLADMRFGIKTGKRDVWDVGAGLELGFDFIMGGKELNERNYTNYPGTTLRGYGAALTYYGVYPFPSVYGGVYATGSLYNILSLDYSATFSDKRITVENGWDRWDALEARNIYEVNAGVLKHKVTAGIDLVLSSIILSYCIENHKDFFSVLNSGEAYSPVGIKLLFSATMPQLIYANSVTLQNDSQRPTLAKDMGLEFIPNFSIGIQADMRGSF